MSCLDVLRRSGSGFLFLLFAWLGLSCESGTIGSLPQDDDQGTCTNAPNLTLCEDGDPCTEGDVCVGGECKGVAVDQDQDGDPPVACGGDDCDDTDPAVNSEEYESAIGEAACADGKDNDCDGLTDGADTGCQACAADVDCGDGNVCNGAEHCAAGACVAGTALNCDDGNPCTTDGCDPAQGCEHQDNAASCDDNDPCTAGDGCVGGTCQGAVLDQDQDGDPPVVCGGGDCDDTDPAVNSEEFESANGDAACGDGKDNDCDGLTDGADPGCQACADDNACDDGNVCNGAEVCTSGVCQTGTLPDCDDDNVCTTDSCDPALGCQHVATACDLDAAFEWPTITRTMRPWAYWWWHGSAVTKADLDTLLAEYHAAGYGGLHIVPIYGVTGNDAFNVDFLSDGWMDLLSYTVEKGDLNDLDIDMTTGTGWPFGGPMVTGDMRSVKTGTAGSEFRTIAVAAGQALNVDLTTSGQTVDAVMAFPSGGGAPTSLMSHIDSGGVLTWTAPGEPFTVYALVHSLAGQSVKRAAPGGVGPVLDPYSVSSVDAYLGTFDSAFAGYAGARPRAQYHDSFEYYFDGQSGSRPVNWSPQFMARFAERRGYDLAEHLPELFDSAGAGGDNVARVKSDYRETISDLHIDYIAYWAQWAAGNGMKTRNQAHGVSPANWLDAYAAADIPETEGGIQSFIPSLRQTPVASWIMEDALYAKFASSAAHVTGKKWVSSESATWMDEHFKPGLSQVKAVIDQFFAAGVNHVFYHGVAYSPSSEAWPGRLFYAETNFAKSNPQWRELPELNHYIARVQSVLQEGEPASEVLLYFTIYDYWNEAAGLETLFWNDLKERSFYSVAKALLERGYPYDYISDRQITDGQTTALGDGRIQTAGGAYRVLVVPECERMPVATLQKLSDLANQGATILFVKHLPADVPGLKDLATRRATFSALKAAATFSATGTPDVSHAPMTLGHFYLAANAAALEPMLTLVAVRREPMVDLGLEFIRRKTEVGHSYFVVNPSAAAVNGNVELGVTFASVVLLDPRFDDRAGKATTTATAVRLQLAPGESLVMRALSGTVDGPPWRYATPADGLATLSLPAAPTIESCSGSYAVNPPPQDRDCVRALDGSGLDVGGQAGAHSTSPYGTMWLSASGSVVDQQFLIIDLGQTCDVDSLRVWNYNEVTTGGVVLTGRGVQQAEISVSTDNVAYSIPQAVTFDIAAGNQTSDYHQDVAVDGATAIRYLRLKVVSNWDGATNTIAYVGLSEIRFFGSCGASSPFTVTFLDPGDGGPPLPPSYSTTVLGSWTGQGSAATQWFSGTARYEVDFALSSLQADDYLLDLGAVRENATVWLNGVKVDTLYAFPYKTRVGDYLQVGSNQLGVEVTNLPANRIHWMDAQGITWRKFFFLNILYQDPFPSTADEAALPSGLLGPVKIVPLSLE